MEVKKTDRRKLRTRQTLRAALLALIRERGYNALNIQEITDRANVARATFYLHYRDKEELLIECMEVMVQQFIERIRQYPAEGWVLTDGAPILQVFQYAQEQSGLYRMLMRDQAGVKASRRLYELIASNTQRLLESQISERGLKPRLPVDFICNYYAGSLLSLVFWWLEQDMPYPAEEMVRMFREISLNGRAHAIGIDSK